MATCKRLSLVTLCAFVCSLMSPSVGEAQSRDSLLNGTIAGLAAGTATGAVLTFTDAGGPLSKRYCENESGRHCTASALVGTVLFGGIGAGIGALVDSWRPSRGNRPIQDRPLDVAPIIRRDHKGMAVRFRF